MPVPPTQACKAAALGTRLTWAAGPGERTEDIEVMTMTKRGWIIGGATAAAAFAGVVAIGSSMGPVGPAWAHGGWSHGSPHGRGFAGFCHVGIEHGMLEQRAQGISERVESELSLNPQQSTALGEVRARLGDAAGLARSLCDELGDEPAASAPERLARMERFMSTGLEALKIVRPAVDSFYATLDEAQKEKLDELMARHRHWRRHH
jgi:hypothetical protein